MLQILNNPLHFAIRLARIGRFAPAHLVSRGKIPLPVARRINLQRLYRNYRLQPELSFVKLYRLRALLVAPAGISQNFLYSPL